MPVHAPSPWKSSKARAAKKEELKEENDCLLYGSFMVNTQYLLFYFLISSLPPLKTLSFLIRAKGDVDMGITGQDIVAEHNVSDDVDELEKVRGCSLDWASTGLDNKQK